jgi:poly(hydroxyalkanoate) depolymerase family esterase
MTRRGRLAALGAAVLLALVLAPAVQAARPTGSFTRHTYGRPGAIGTRDYWLYVPAAAGANRPLIVFLHGCIQTAEQAAAATRLNQLADRFRFVAVYPQQNVTTGSSAPAADGNGEGCWNWFLPDDQQRGKGEPATIAGITEQVVQAARSDRSRIFVEGVSAGADMSTILGATYPDVYAAVGSWAGCAYSTCGDGDGALTYQAMGSRARQVPMFVVQGTADTLNAFPLSQGLVDSWLGADDWADDGLSNASVSRTPASVEHHGFDQTPKPGTGDPCVRNQNFPCPGGVAGFQGTYPYTIEHYAGPHGCTALDFWIIHGLEHSVPHADSSTPFTDPLGPDATSASYDFFMRHPKGASC